jgi:hypothetical protein
MRYSTKSLGPYRGFLFKLLLVVLKLISVQTFFSNKKQKSIVVNNIYCTPPVCSEEKQSTIARLQERGNISPNFSDKEQDAALLALIKRGGRSARIVDDEEQSQKKRISLRIAEAGMLEEGGDNSSDSCS